MPDFMVNMFASVRLMELVFILLAKIAERTISTLRQILITKGYRREGTFLSLVEVLLWTFAASQVIIGITEAPIKGIVYSIGFSIGVYFGSLIEARLAMGQVMIQAIVEKTSAAQITAFLREKGCAVTTMDAQGRDSEKEMLTMFANRKGKEIIVSNILQLDQSAMIITNDVTTLQGGTIVSSRKMLR